MSRVAAWLLAWCFVLGRLEPGQATVPADFRLLAPVTGVLQPESPVRLRLPREVIAEAQAGLADVRLFDDQGVETPYVIYPQSAPPFHTIVLPVLAYTQDQEGESIVLQRPPQAGPVSELSIQTSARDFHKIARLQVSHDQVIWSDVVTEALFDFSSRIDVRKTTLPFPATEAPYLRLLLKDVTPPRSDAAGIQLRYDGLELVTRGETARPFRIDQISGRVGTAQALDTLYDHALMTSPETTATTSGQTLLLLGRLNLPLAQVSLTAENTYYHRRVEVWGADLDKDDSYHQVASGVIYKLPGVATAEATLRLPPMAYPYVRLKIFNGDNPPLRLQAVDIAWRRHYLYFVPAAGRRYTLSVGNAQVRAPVYELQHLLPAPQAGRESYPSAGLGELHPQPQYTLSPPRGKSQVESLLLTALVLLLAAGLGWWAYRLLKTVAKPGD